MIVTFETHWFCVSSMPNVTKVKTCNCKHGFYCAMLRWDWARYWYGKLSVCQSVCLSVMLRYYDHIGWNSSKIISRLVSLVCSLCAEPNIMDLLHGKSGFQHTKALIYLKWDKIGPKLLLRTIGSPIRAFDWCQNQWPWMTLRMIIMHSVPKNVCLGVISDVRTTFSQVARPRPSTGHF